ncbi:hypothetical protein tinsulaeT_00230 [Thalassotalea insulae]|uniref:Uncharacterized protein n=1 Tax=Thalassotalea insulae TaxID=2056778 RepID=A0ABQ6GKZ4_9GAMM|nr:hypothetical protein [Thalassotalea insulae]GLX76683.1 hypothetical protein tinsulaeT_00230 [Thalassotalea insulae]
MKQPFVLLFALVGFFGPVAIVMYFDGGLAVLMATLMITTPLTMGTAMYFESKNVKNGSVDLSKQSKANKVLTYSLATLLLLIFILPVIFKILGS